MILLHALDLSLPLKNPVLIFALILLIILFAPIILNKLKIPHLIGLIIAGAVIGPNGFNLMLRDMSIVLYGTVGLLYIMFLAGLEIDMADFKKNSQKSLVFGLLTFSIPMTLGTLVGYYFLEFSMMTSVLLASMFASHTLLAYPIISKLGVTKNRAVNITVGGTVITDTLALLVLAAIAGMANGNANGAFWLQLSVSVLVFGAIIMFVFPIIGRWFFKKFDDNISQYIFVLAMVFLGAFLAELAGVEHIIGAFLVGLSLNRLIPHTSPLMNRVEFVGNALFIPFFLIGVGMLIDYRIFFKDINTIIVAVTMIVVATTSKFIAAWITQKTFNFTKDERRLIFGLSNAQAAATLAAVLVGYNIILNKDAVEAAALLGEVVEPVRLLNESVLNGTILMILFTCTIASFVAQKGAQNVALLDAAEDDDQLDENESILVAVNDLNTTEELMNLALTVKSKSNKSGLFALNIVENDLEGSSQTKLAKKILEKAVTTASAADMRVRELLRYDVNVVNGITNAAREQKTTDLILGLSSNKGISDSFFGNLTDGILNRSNATTLIYKPTQPIGTIKRHLVFVPNKAEKEIGFLLWLLKVWNIARNTGAKLVFYSGQETLKYIDNINQTHPIECDFVNFEDWEDFLILSREMQTNDNLIIVMSRKENPSYHPQMAKIPNYLNKYFKDQNYLMIYPIQADAGGAAGNYLKNIAMVDSIEKLDDLGKSIASLFKRK